MTARVANPYAGGRGPKPKTAQQHIDDNSVHSGECLLWTGPISPDGYGKAWFQGRSTRANRLAFLAANGAWPEHQALHTCDTPLCVEGSHLYDGTQQQNMDDKMNRGRWRGGRPKKGER